MGIEKHFALLGYKATDAVTQKSGVVTSICFDLYGCIQACVHFIGKDGEEEQKWLDVIRLKAKGNPVITPPDFVDRPPVSTGLRGPAEKPTF